MSIQDRVVVISGATGGLGRVVARQFGKGGARLALFDRSLERLEGLVDELEIPGERRLLREVDVSSPEAVQEAAQAALEKFGRIDVLINLVGGWIGGKPLAEAAEEEVAGMLQQHLWTTFYLTQAFVPHMLENGWGRVMAVSSPTAFNPPGKTGPYSIGKAAQEALMLSLAQEVRGTGVTANTILVRTIDTQHEREKAPTSKNASWTTPEEIASALVYLCSEEAGMVNGARIPMYGRP